MTQMRKRTVFFCIAQILANFFSFCKMIYVYISHCTTWIQCHFFLPYFSRKDATFCRSLALLEIIINDYFDVFTCDSTLFGEEVIVEFILYVYLHVNSSTVASCIYRWTVFVEKNLLRNAWLFSFIPFDRLHACIAQINGRWNFREFRSWMDNPARKKVQNTDK